MHRLLHHAGLDTRASETWSLALALRLGQGETARWLISVGRNCTKEAIWAGALSPNEVLERAEKSPTMIQVALEAGANPFSLGGSLDDGFRYYTKGFKVLASEARSWLPLCLSELLASFLFYSEAGCV